MSHDHPRNESRTGKAEGGGMSYPEESLYWKGRGMVSSQSEPVVSSNGQGEAAATELPARSQLAEYLSRRREEICGLMASLRVELVEIGVAETALGLPRRRSYIASRTQRPGSIKDLALRALVDADRGLTSAEVGAALAASGRPTRRETLTPQLSRLKAAGLLTFADRRWLASRTPP